jgi:hypothetical protein
VPHKALLELTGGGDHLLRRFLGPLYHAKNMGDGLLLGEGRDRKLHAPKDQHVQVALIGTVPKVTDGLVLLFESEE